jgi:glutamate formiminotransferase
MKQLELFEERAAIMEFDGGMERKKAERLAMKDVFPFLPMSNEKRNEFESIGWSAGKAIRFLSRKA